ncbi:MAG: dihydrodipicolinate synthase family protein, partial [Bacillota bacterium]
MSKFPRMITAMVTPFKDDLSVDYEGAQKLALYLIESGNDGLVISGTTGESPTLSLKEKLSLFTAVKEAVGNKGQIIAGTGSNSTADSIYLTQEAEKIGVDGIMAVVPYYNKPNQEGMYQHFKAIATETSLPVML